MDMVQYLEMKEQFLTDSIREFQKTRRDVRRQLIRAKAENLSPVAKTSVAAPVSSVAEAMEVSGAFERTENTENLSDCSCRADGHRFHVEGCPKRIGP